MTAMLKAPDAQLRRELFEFVLAHTDMPDYAVAIARDAYNFIVGETGATTLAIAIQEASERAGQRPPVIGHGDVLEPEEAEPYEVKVARKDPAPAPEPKASRDVPPGASWAFRDHRNQAQLDGNPAATLSPKHDEAMAGVRAMLADGTTVTGNALGKHLGWSQVTASRYLRDLVEAGFLVRKGPRTAPAFVPAEEADEPVPPRNRDYTAVVWTYERKDILDRMVREGAEAEDIATACGLSADQVKAQITRQCLTAIWAAAKDAKAGTEPAKPKAALKGATLPEDRLRGGLAEPEGAPADMETVETWLAANGCKVSHAQEIGGEYRCDGKLMTGRELLALANRARKSVNLPPFVVRRL
ncbi:MAG: hypothetical protein AB1918_11610 [Pseudomonadota bacterium]